MMKNFFFGIVVLFLQITAFAQTTFWSENFKTGEGWNLEDNWTVTGEKLQFYWSPEANNFDLRATSSPVSLDEHVTELVITQYLDIFSGTNDESAQIILVASDEEFVLWDYPLINGNWGSFSGSDLILPIQEYAGMDVQIQFRTFGLTTFNWNEWDIFEINLMANYTSDLAAVNLSGPVALNVLETGIWTVDVKNMGSDPANGYTVSIFENKSNNLIGTITETETIEPGETRFYDFEWSSNAAFNTSFKAWIDSPDDQFSGNNKSKSSFVRIHPDVEMNILVWDHDNGIQTVQDPEKGDLITPSKGMKRVLDDAGIDYDFYTYIPDNLDTYDIVFSTMGCFCVD
ncbi:MAG: hypothetical protein KQI35_09140 [Bacteroidetes bacterium]|nr:hypothetical protein [Bacteroidota bacterium]